VGIKIDAGLVLPGNTDNQVACSQSWAFAARALAPPWNCFGMLGMPCHYNPSGGMAD
jgi:hypothetical protein